MKKNNDKTTVHLFVDKADIERFERSYPRCRQRFLANCLKMAANDKVFFEKIFFMELLKHGEVLNL